MTSDTHFPTDDRFTWDDRMVHIKDSPLAVHVGGHGGLAYLLVGTDQIGVTECVLFAGLRSRFRPTMNTYS